MCCLILCPLARAAEGMAFTGDSPIYEATSSPALDLGDKVTLEAWVQADPMPGGGGRIIDRMPPGSQDGYLLDTWPGNSLRLITANGQLRFDARLPADKWTHVAGVYNSPKKIMRLYINGKEVAATQEGKFPPLSKCDAPLRIGADPNGENRFLGRVRRAAVYSRALTADEIARRFADASAKLDGTVGDWIFAEKSPDRLTPVAGNVSLRIPLAYAGSTAAPEQPLSLWYRKPAARWTEAMVLGNGRIGGMVWGGVEREQVDLNEDTLWSGEPSLWKNPEALPNLPRIRQLLLEGKNKEASDLVRQKMHGVYNQCYMPMGKLVLDIAQPEDVRDYRRDLDLTQAIARVRYTAGQTAFVRETFISAVDQALVMRLSADKPGAIAFAASLKSELRPKVSGQNGQLILDGRCPIQADPSYVGQHRVIFDDAANPRGMKFQMRLAARADGGSAAIEKEQLVVKGANSVTLLLTAATSFNGPHKSPSREGRDQAAIAAADMTKALAKTDAQLRTDHVADHQRLFNRVSLNIGSPAGEVPTDQRLRKYEPGKDPGLAALYYQFGRYLLIASSRPGTQPANLQGIWNISLNPDWSANWTLNCNAQINYWPVESANLSECHLPLLDLVEELKLDGYKTAREIYGARGWVAHHNTDLWRGAGPVDGDPVWFIFQTGGAWLCQHIWEHYQFTGDVDFLRRSYPTLRDAARYFLDTMIHEPKHNWLVDAPATNFENHFRKPSGETASVCMAPTADVQMIRQLLLNCIAAAQLLDIDPDFRAECEKAIAQLPPMQISPRTGHLQEWLDDWDHADPHNCQMLSQWGVICSNQITPRGTPDLAKAVLKTMQDRGVDQGTGSWQGAFPSNSYARLGQADKALYVIDRHLKHNVNPNFSANFGGMAAWEIDGNLGITSAIGEMLLQSHTGEIHLLPALPAAWPTGSVAGLRARGGFVVDLTWKSGKLTESRIQSLLGNPLTIRYGEKSLSPTIAREQTYRFSGE
jgi:alpha-L-fucosidase 2